jgi:hypothetical protein
MSKKKQSVAERAVRGFLGGWVYGKKYIAMAMPDPDCSGSVHGVVHVMVPAESVKRMLADEKKARKRTVK